MSKSQPQRDNRPFKEPPMDADNQERQTKNKRTQWYFAAGLILLWALVYIAIKLNVINSL